MVAIKKSIDNKVESISGTLLVIGDLHTSPKYKGTHIDYAMSSIKVLELVRDLLQKHKIKNEGISLMLLGDTFGVNERNFNDEFYLNEVGRWYKQFNEICDNHVYSVRGNHDMGEYTTFDFAKDAGWIRNPKYVDMTDTSGRRICRMHIVNYGHEHDELDLLSDGQNAVFGHNDYAIPGVTPTYGGKEGNSTRGDRVLLSELDNFIGVSLVVSGHIHTPLMRNDAMATLSDGSSVQLLIPGSPSRVAEKIDTCYDVVFTSSQGKIDFTSEPIKLWPVEEEFIPNELTEEQANYVEDLQKRDADIKEILSAVIEGRLGEQYNNLTQIDKIPGFSQEVRKEAKERYLKYASAPES